MEVRRVWCRSPSVAGCRAWRLHDLGEGSAIFVGLPTLGGKENARGQKASVRAPERM
jgi:hypothetical protein